MHRFARGLPAALIATVVVLAGCSGSGGTPTAVSSNGPISSTAPDASAVPAGGTTATCTQLTIDEAQPLLNVPLKTVHVTPAGLSGGGQECRFVGADESDYVDVIVIGGSEGPLEYANDVQGFPSPAPLPGVGDKAMWDSNNESSSFAALKGDVYCSVEGEDENVPGVGALMDAANNTLRIGDANWKIIANAMATLCNRIYGSGDTTVDLSGLSAPPSSAP